MSRVDEALRRAAEAAAQHGTTETPNAIPPSIGVDAAEFAGESYPIEMQERRRLRPIPTTPAAGNPAPIEDLPLSAKAASQSLFEHLDARLAAKVVVDQAMMPSSREQYRRLAASLHHRQASSGLKVVMIASAVMGEGKTLQDYCPRCKRIMRGLAYANLPHATENVFQGSRVDRNE